MPKRSEQRDTAKAEYVERRNRGEKINLREFADKLGVNYKTLRDWKRIDKWDEGMTPPKKKRGGQPGNRNSAGKKNAAGSHPGAPLHNKNAEKDGAYSTVFFDALTDEEYTMENMIQNIPVAISMVLPMVLVLMVITNIVVEVLKKLTLGKLPTNIVVFVVAMTLTLLAFLAVCQIVGIAVVWYMVVGAIILGIFVAYAAMFGFDKLKQTLEQINSIKNE